MLSKICPPFAYLPASFPQIPPAQLPYEACFLGNRNEFLRPEQAALRMLPSQQSLEADDVSGGEVDNRLVKIAKLFPLEGMTEIRLQLQSCHHAGPHICVKHLVAGFAERLSSIHGGVGIAQNIFRLFVRRIAQCDADAYGSKHFFATEDEGRCESLHHAVRGALGVAWIFNVVEHNGEFISPEARDREGLS